MEHVSITGNSEIGNLAMYIFREGERRGSEDWAALAAEYLLAFGNRTGAVTVDTAIIDLITNMMHLWEHLGMADFQQMVNMAAIHFESEKDTE